MNRFAYYAVMAAIGIGVLIALVVMIVSFVAMIVYWRTPRRRKHAIRLLAALATIPCLIGFEQAIIWWVVVPALGRQMTAELNAARADKLAKTSVLHVGHPAPHFSLRTVDGNDFSLDTARGNVILVNFFATWCGPCQLELPHIERIWATRKSQKNFRLLVVGREETEQSVREYRDKNGFSFPMAADPERTIYSLFAHESIPRTLVVSPHGLIVYSKAGFIEDDLDELNAVLEEQLAALR